MGETKARRSKTGWLFVLVTCSVIAGAYADFLRTYYWEAMGPSKSRSTARVYLAVMHFLLFLQLWSLLQVMLSRPGTVPPFWVLSIQGFALGDAASTRRRYCLMCHVFKPERCHHCSVCNRCVLQMDHHCPWVNNCVGFTNRKFFLLLLFYTIVGLIADLVISVARGGQYSLENSENLLSIGIFAFLLGLAIVLINFFRFHLSLVFSNKTTIEHIEQTRTGELYNDFDIGYLNNWKQVFGPTPWLWLLPLYESPVGDGVRWARKSEQPVPALLDTPKASTGTQQLMLSTQKGAFNQLRKPDAPFKPENDSTVQAEESAHRVVSNSSMLSQSFK